MMLSKAARYALLAAAEMARSRDPCLVTAAGVARRHQVPGGAMSKVLQRLVRSGLAVGVRGPHGGYRLARAPSEITVLDVLNVFEPHAFAEDSVGEEPVGTLLDRVDVQLQSTFSSVTLDAFAENESAPDRPAPDPALPTATRTI